jgi:hypothetical protein
LEGYGIERPCFLSVKQSGMTDAVMPRLSHFRTKAMASGARLNAAP